MRMRAYVEDEDMLNAQNKKNFSNKFKYFRDILCNIQNPQHPNLSYFIYKSIILRNLYGVDIMKEAVEIAKLRLFLKLVATVDPDYSKQNLGLEPLPDIDFNIRAGNTLIGYASKKEIEVLQGLFITPKMKDDILEECDIVAMAFRRFKELQLKGYENKKEFTEAKNDLNKRLKKLSSNLNKILYKQHYEGMDYHIWETTHQPFHWFAEFYEIINDNGGFNIVIGNPPYVEYSKVKGIYTIIDIETEKCYNLYGYVIEKSYKLLHLKGLVGMIVPISAFSNSSMESLQKFFRKFKLTFLSNYHQRPAALFEGVLQRLSIFIAYKENIDLGVYSTIVYRWKSENRNLLFPRLFYIKGEQDKQYNSLKIGYEIETKIFKKYIANNVISILIRPDATGNNSIHYRTAGGGYWVTILNSPFKTNSLSNKTTTFQDEYSAKVISAILNSNLFWWYYSINFDQFNFKDYMIFGFRFNYPTRNDTINELNKLSDKLEKELLQNATTYIIKSKTRGSNETITYNKYYSKETMDDIDTVLAKHYGFSEEELDFIINYDIKYRMGRDEDNNED